MAETYLAIMLQSLKKKEKVLDEIIRLNDLQKDQLTDQTRSVDEFDKTVEDKAACIQQLEQLDSGFEELEADKEKYADLIRQLQDRIRIVTDKSVMIQAQEARNKDFMMQKFTTVKQQAKGVRANSKAITGYYKTMKQSMYEDMHMLDGKR